MAKILGLSFFFHESAAAVVCGGKIIAAAAEERFCRRKHTAEFPKLAIEYCLEAAGLKSINELDAIVFYEKPITKFMRILETLIQTWPLSLTTFTSQLPTFLSTKFNVAGAIANHLPGYQGEILFTEHHLSHAASAFFCSPFEEAAILTVDGVGEWETTTIGSGRGREIQLSRALHFPHSVGLLYSALTSYLGFRVNDGEWKVMGLAPYGQPHFREQFRRLVDVRDDGSFRLNMEYFSFHYSSRWTAKERRWQRLFGFPRRQSKTELAQHHEDLACSGQAVVEEIILGLARAARRNHDCDNLVIAGGVGLNSVANWKIEEQGIFKNVWIQPAAGDDGGALGAALVVAHQTFGDPRTGPLRHAFLGPDVSNAEAEDFLERREVPFQRLSDEALVEQTADLIASGKVVGWCRGRMEFGPRALGSRSILADATNPEMKAIINRKIKYREYFRPFAPAVPLEHVHEYFEVLPGTDLPFMLKVPLVRPEKRSLIPAVTHEDGSGRVQTMTEDVNPLYYRLMKAMIPRCGAPVILNTSFNIRGEPIVCSSEDAYNCFVNTDIDALVIGNCLVTAKPVQRLSSGQGYALSDALEAEIGRDDGPERPLAAPLVQEAFHRNGTPEIGKRVLNFYKDLPFNYYSNAADMAAELMKGNRIREYPVLHHNLNQLKKARVLDVGCGAGWFVNSCAHYYGHAAIGVDLNPKALREARAVARFMTGCQNVQFLEADVFNYEPDGQFDVVNSLGVLHHTANCHAAIRRVLHWVAAKGFLHLGLYHSYGRQPFLEHFARLRQEGGSDAALYQEFARLNPEITDSTHLLSWFRDQVLHPHETQHSFEEIYGLLESSGFHVEATSINHFQAIGSVDTLFQQEKTYARFSENALYKKGRYFPGFFVVWARRR
jgi:carbamoyltransferase